ncbi:MAG: hypothetical protein IJP70_12050 [Bacteroidales bacterium]|nr:hypothetical protein [Bacteroidales bacterium]
MKKFLIVANILAFVVFAGCGSQSSKTENTQELASIQESASYGVDLGLSVNWAVCNVGAENPEEVGVRVPLGNVTGTVKSPKLESMNVSGTDKDIAKVMMGDGWRMPAGKEMRELVDECEWNVETVNGHNGFRVTGKNGNSIFLPNSGSNYLSESFSSMDFEFTDNTNISYEGNYWCGTPDADEVYIVNGYEYGCNHLNFNTDTSKKQFMICDLYFCCAVRAVHEK